MLENQSYLISKNSPYNLRDENPDLDKFFPRVGLRLLFATFPESVTKALNIVRPLPPLVYVIKIDEGKNVVMRPGLQPAFTALYRN